jgi:MmyB-like transcription regulator ligand binding domain
MPEHQPRIIDPAGIAPPPGEPLGQLGLARSPGPASTTTRCSRAAASSRGTLNLDFEAMEFPAHPGLTLLVYTAAAATPAADNLKLLASWAATAEQTGDLPSYA